MLFGSLVELHAWLHSYLCFSLLEKLFLSNLDSFSTPGYLSSFSNSFYRNLDSFSIVGGSIKLPLAVCWFVPWQILDSCICWWFKLSTPLSIDVSTPLDTSICRALLTFNIKVQCDLVLTFLDLSLSTNLSFHLPKHSLSLQTSFQAIFQAFSSVFFTW